MAAVGDRNCPSHHASSLTVTTASKRRFLRNFINAFRTYLLLQQSLTSIFRALSHSSYKELGGTMEEVGLRLLILGIVEFSFVVVGFGFSVTSWCGFSPSVWLLEVADWSVIIMLILEAINTTLTSWSCVALLSGGVPGIDAHDVFRAAQGDVVTTAEGVELPSNRATSCIPAPWDSTSSIGFAIGIQIPIIPLLVALFAARSGHLIFTFGVTIASVTPLYVAMAIELLRPALGDVEIVRAAQRGRFFSATISVIGVLLTVGIMMVALESAVEAGEKVAKEAAKAERQAFIATAGYLSHNVNQYLHAALAAWDGMPVADAYGDKSEDQASYSGAAQRSPRPRPSPRKPPIQSRGRRRGGGGEGGGEEVVEEEEEDVVTVEEVHLKQLEASLDDGRSGDWGEAGSQLSDTTMSARESLVMYQLRAGIILASKTIHDVQDEVSIAEGEFRPRTKGIQAGKLISSTAHLVSVLTEVQFRVEFPVLGMSRDSRGSDEHLGKMTRTPSTDTAVFSLGTSEEPLVEVDDARLEQMLVAALGNAAKKSPMHETVDVIAHLADSSAAVMSILAADGVDELTISGSRHLRSKVTRTDLEQSRHESTSSPSTKERSESCSDASPRTQSPTPSSYLVISIAQKGPNLGTFQPQELFLEQAVVTDASRGGFASVVEPEALLVRKHSEFLPDSATRVSLIQYESAGVQEQDLRRGRGLGLAILGHIASELGGGMGLNDRPDGKSGTVFHLVLPVRVSAKVAAIATDEKGPIWGKEELSVIEESVPAVSREAPTALKHASSMTDPKVSHPVTKESTTGATMDTLDTVAYVRDRESQESGGAMSDGPRGRVNITSKSRQAKKRTRGRGSRGQLEKVFEGCVVLVVDDEAMNLGVAERMASSLGGKSIGHRSGEAAIEWFSKKSATTPNKAAQYVLLDYHMGSGMNGADVATRLRLSGFTNPIIITTGGLSQADEGACKRAGVDAIIFKPFRTTDIIKSVKSLQREKRGGGME